MKKKIFYGITVLAIAATAAFNVNVNSEKNLFESAMLANIEALAIVEDNPPPCGEGCKEWDESVTTSKGMKCSNCNEEYKGKCTHFCN